MALHKSVQNARQSSSGTGNITLVIPEYKFRSSVPYPTEEVLRVIRNAFNFPHTPTN